MKAIISLAILASLLTGCVGIKYQQTTVTADGTTNTCLIEAKRFFWSTEAYAATINTNGTGSLTASKSTVDSVALGAVAYGVANGLAKGAKP